VAANIQAANIDVAFTMASRQRKAGATAAAHMAATLDPTITWDGLAWLQAAASLPLVRQGVLTADDDVTVRRGTDVFDAGLPSDLNGDEQYEGCPP